MSGDTLGLAGDGSHKNQATTNLEVLVRFTSNEELATGVDREDAVELLGGNILDVAEGDDAAVGADNVELAKLLLGLLEEADDLLNVGDVGLDGGGVGAVLLDLADDLVGGLVAVCVVDDNLGTATSELESHLSADTTA